MTADNTILITEDPYRQIWAMATLEYTSDKVTFRDVLRSTNRFTIEDALEDENIKYVVRLDSRDQNKIQECKENREKLEKNKDVKVLYSNENGFVAKIK